MDSFRNCTSRTTWMSSRPEVPAAIGSVGAASIDSFPIDSVQMLKMGIEFDLEMRKSPS